MIKRPELIQTFVIPGKLPSLNDYVEACRKHPRSGANMKKKHQGRVKKAIKEHGMSPMPTPVIVEITWFEPNRRRDKDNVRFGVKFILDGLVEAGIIRNDTWNDIEDIHDTYKVDRKNPRIEVTLVNC